MLGGEPPYKFSLEEGFQLPGNLRLNHTTGVISGNLDQVPNGYYTFRIQCSDSKGRLASSMSTSSKYEEFLLIIR